jgi:deazaflavin-dependent oxidoreductase (nitroreductase family)
MPDFDTVVRERRSVRRYLPAPVPDDVLSKVLDAAQQTPSNCNTQPWQVHILSGEIKDAFSTTILTAFESGIDTKDFSFAVADYDAESQSRARAQGAAYYQALGIARDDHDQRNDAARHNLSFFGAPHVALLFAPNVGDNVRIAADIGMYAQTFLLALTANGLAGIPQTMLGSYAEQARILLGLPEDVRLLFGISFGYADLDHPAARYDIDRIPASQSVFRHTTYEPDARMDGYRRQHIDKIRETGTTDSVRGNGLPIVLVTMRGAKTGKLREVPVMRVEHDQSYAVVGSKGASPQHPAWYHNLKAHPEVSLQDGSQTKQYVAREVEGDERAEWWERAVAAYPAYAEMQKITERVIPVFVLDPI